MNEKKIAFIICANNELYYEECIWYISQIEIPKGYEVDTICVADAESMPAAYNAAMESSDAKYKVYLHQDVFIYNSKFIEDILRIFESDSELGMLGVIGGRQLSQDADMCMSWDSGRTFCCDSGSAVFYLLYQNEKANYTEVDAVDGMLMVTQYDIKWRDDLDLGWDFYDVSQSLEFKRKGYKIGVPFQKEAWCMHDCGYSKMEHYDEKREKVLKEYIEFFSKPFEEHYNLGIVEHEQKLFMQIKESIEQGELEQAVKIAEQVRTRNIQNTNLQYALNILEIYEAEKSEGLSISFFENLYTWEEIKNKYDEIKFMLRRVESKLDIETENYLKKLLCDNIISAVAVAVIIKHTSVGKQAMSTRIFGVGYNEIR